MLVVAAGAACAHPSAAPAPAALQRLPAGCYVVDARFDSAGERRLGDSGRVSAVHPDTVGLGGGPTHWQDTVALTAALSPRDQPDSLGPFYQVRPSRPYMRQVWQSRGDSVWIYWSNGLVGSTDAVRGEGSELRGSRTYRTDTGAVYYATVRYSPAPCLGF
jgi:hypothetical protein